MQKVDDITRQDYLENYQLQMQKIGLLPKFQDALVPDQNSGMVQLNELREKYFPF